MKDRAESSNELRILSNANDIYFTIFWFGSFNKLMFAWGRNRKFDTASGDVRLSLESRRLVQRHLHATAGRWARRKERICRAASGIRSFGSFHGNMLTSAFGASIAASIATA